MSRASRRLAAVLLIVFPTVIFGGASLLSMIIRADPDYLDNDLRRDLFRAGHAHAGVILALSLVVLRYVDEAALSPGLKWFARVAAPIAAILLPLAFFGSVAQPSATEPSALIYLAVAGALLLTAGLIVLGVGLWRARSTEV